MNDNDRDERNNDTNRSTVVIVKVADSFREERNVLSVSISISPAGTGFDVIIGMSCSTSTVKTRGLGARSITWLATLPSFGFCGYLFDERIW